MSVLRVGFTRELPPPEGHVTERRRRGRIIREAGEKDNGRSGEEEEREESG